MLCQRSVTEIRNHNHNHLLALGPFQSAVCSYKYRLDILSEIEFITLRISRQFPYMLLNTS